MYIQYVRIRTLVDSHSLSSISTSVDVRSKAAPGGSIPVKVAEKSSSNSRMSSSKMVTFKHALGSEGVSTKDPDSDW